jgi:DNA-binding NarL/FixJ family response regulator
MRDVVAPGTPYPHVVSTASGEERVLVRTEALRPQVVVLGPRMPGTTGLEMIPQLRPLLRAVKIVVLTQPTARGYCEAALAAGADEFVSDAGVNGALPPHENSGGCRPC